MPVNMGTFFLLKFIYFLRRLKDFGMLNLRARRNWIRKSSVVRHANSGSPEKQNSVKNYSKHKHFILKVKWKKCFMLYIISPISSFKIFQYNKCENDLISEPSADTTKQIASVTKEYKRNHKKILQYLCMIFKTNSYFIFFSSININFHFPSVLSLGFKF